MTQPLSKNKALSTVSDIDMLLQRNCADLTTESEDDRAKLAWWIYQTFIKGDYRKQTHEESTTKKEDGK